MLGCDLCEKKCCADLEHGNSSNGAGLLGGLCYKICRRIADYDIKLIFNGIEVCHRVMTLEIHEIVLVVNGDEQSHVVIVAAFLAYALKVVLKHRNKVGIVLVAGKEYLLAPRGVFAYMLNDSSAEYTRSGTGVENRVSALLGIKTNGIRHKTRSILFCEESSESYVFRLGFFSYKFACVSYGEVKHT